MIVHECHVEIKQQFTFDKREIERETFGRKMNNFRSTYGQYINRDLHPPFKQCTFANKQINIVQHTHIQRSMHRTS